MMNQQKISKQTKQNYLRNQILEGGFDAQSFMDFIGTVKQQGQQIDLQIWSMQELQKVVSDFKNQIKTDQEALVQVQKSQILQSKQFLNLITKSLMLKKQKVNYDKGLQDYQLFNEQPCRILQKAFNFDTKSIRPTVQIKKWEVRTVGGFFLGFGATKQLWMTIQTNFTQKIIQRTNSDIQWLRNTMLKKFPSSYIPPLRQLRSIQPQDKFGLNNRVKRIQQFLNSVVKFDYLIQSTLCKQFFCESDHNKFTNFKNKQKSINTNKDIGMISTLNGKLQLQISQKIQKHLKNCSGFSKVIHETYTELDGQINKILGDMQTLSKHVLYVSNSCGVLHQKYAKICSLNQIQQSSMQSIMLYLNNVFSNIGKNIKDHINIIKQFSDSFIQSTLRSWQQFNLYDKKYQRQVQSYLNYKLQLLKKKQNNYTDYKKWDLPEQQQKKVARMNLSSMNKDQIFNIMFPKDNKKQEEMRLWIAYVNRVYLKSFRMLLKQEENQIKQKFISFIEHYRKVSNQSDDAFSQFQQMLQA